MEQAIQIFSNPQFGEIRTAGTNENPMFCLADLCRVLELRVDGVTPRLKKDGYNRIGVIDSMGRKQDAIFVNEQNLYRVIMRSDKPQAEAFQDWVCGEVLPSIRKTGGYIAATTDMTDEEIMAKALLVAQSTIERRDQRIKELESENKQQSCQIAEMSKAIDAMQPKADYYDMILNNKSTVLVTQIAQDYGMSAKAFNKMLADMGVQRKVGGQWILYAPHYSNGYVQSKPITITRTNGVQDVKYLSEWTQKGRLFLYDLLKENGILPLIEQ